MAATNTNFVPHCGRFRYGRQPFLIAGAAKVGFARHREILEMPGTWAGNHWATFAESQRRMCIPADRVPLEPVRQKWEVKQESRGSIAQGRQYHCQVRKKRNGTNFVSMRHFSTVIRRSNAAGGIQMNSARYFLGLPIIVVALLNVLA